MVIVENFTRFHSFYLDLGMWNFKTKNPEISMDFGILAEKQGFEPWRPFAEPTPLAGEPLRPLGYFSKSVLAEREGFEPPVPFDITGFQDRRLQPLGHLSKRQQNYYIKHI